MAESRHRPPPQGSHSYADLPTPESISLPLKRRMTDASDDPFLSTRSMNPPPLQDPSSLESQRNPSSSARAHPHLRHNIPLTVPHPPAMDPTPSDPEAIFIHPPFTDFPDAHQHKDGLTYNLMATNPNWFLDPADYITTTDSDPNAICYPTQLEPPRGWCPAKKKELKDGWAEGEEPRLRCTFCRRTYAGVNAKSMWRRHVYEKHKIAMANRRDNNNPNTERRGRGSNKENREDKEMAHNAVRHSSTNGQDEALSRKATKSNPPGHSSMSHFRDASDSSLDHSQDDHMDEDEDSSVLHPHVGSTGTDFETDLFQIATSSSTPPLTPGFSPTDSQIRLRKRKLIPESPYNPLLTPSFRHSPARLPSDQPWRFPSPSHPLHKSPRELSLCMLARGEGSPIVSGLDVSPVVIVPPSERRKRSIFSSPLVPLGAEDKETCSDGEGAERTKRVAKSSPRRLFYDGTLPTPFTDRVKFKQYRIPESPLGRAFDGPRAKNLASLVQANDTWRGAKSLTPIKSPRVGTGLLGPIQLDGEDPFVGMLYKPWADTKSKSEENARALSPPPSGSETDSPVLRSSQLSQTDSGTSSKVKDGIGLGPGLMKGFSLKDSASGLPDDDDLMFIYDGRQQQRFSSQLIFTGSPPAHIGKKTRRSLLSSPPQGNDGDYEMQEALQPKKRRRTINGRD